MNSSTSHQPCIVKSTGFIFTLGILFNKLIDSFIVPFKSSKKLFNHSLASAGIFQNAIHIFSHNINEFCAIKS